MSDLLCFPTEVNSFNGLFKEYCTFCSNLATELNNEDFSNGFLGWGPHLSTAEFLQATAQQAADPAAHIIRPFIKRVDIVGTGLEQSVAKDTNRQADLLRTSWALARAWWEQRMDNTLKAWLDVQPSPGYPHGAVIGHSILTLTELLTILIARYRVLSPAALANVMKRLQVQITTSSDFTSRTVDMANDFATLARAGQVESEFSKQLLLASAVSASPILSQLFREYTSRTVLLTDRTFSAAVAFISLQLANNFESTIPIGTAVHSATVVTTEPSIAEQVRVQVAAALAAFVPPAATAKGKKVKAPSPAGAQAAMGPKRERPEGTPGYCWYHGSGRHCSHQCIQMTAAKGFTEAHRKVTSPVVIDGVSGHT